jgi:hypothetical protein
VTNYNISSFEICEAHKCLGTDIDAYRKKNNLPVKFKIFQITDRRGHPKFHFEINGKVCFYGLRGNKS